MSVLGGGCGYTVCALPPCQVVDLRGICEIEVYLVELLLAQYSDMDTTHTAQFSQADSIGE